MTSCRNLVMMMMYNLTRVFEVCGLFVYNNNDVACSHFQLKHVRSSSCAAAAATAAAAAHVFGSSVNN